LSGDPMVTGSSGSGTIWLYIIMLLGVAGFAISIERLDAVPALGLFLFTFCGIAFLDFKIIFHKNYNWNTVFLYLEIGTIFVLILAAKYVLEERNKKFIRSAFVKYV